MDNYKYFSTDYSKDAFSIFKSLFGKGIKLSDEIESNLKNFKNYFKELNFINIKNENDFESFFDDHFNKIILEESDSDLPENLDFEILCFREETDSIGEGPYTTYFKNLKYVLYNKYLGKVFYVYYCGDIDEYGSITELYNNEIFVLDFCEEMLHFINTYNDEKKHYFKEKEQKSLELNIAYDLRKKEEKVILNNRKKSIETILKNNGFINDLSAKGNVTNKFTLSFSVLENLDNVISNLKPCIVTLKINNKGYVEFVSSNIKGIRNIVELYCISLNKYFDCTYYKHSTINLNYLYEFKEHVDNFNCNNSFLEFCSNYFNILKTKKENEYSSIIKLINSIKF